MASGKRWSNAAASFGPARLMQCQRGHIFRNCMNEGIGRSMSEVLVVVLVLGLVLGLLGEPEGTRKLILSCLMYIQVLFTTKSRGKNDDLLGFTRIY